ncbi:hypothetical protein KA025_02500 [Candidatus Saccharibacteria bacterium]|nr:hypothetical protein [Candidatus Saccharibacteria bacterium]
MIQITQDATTNISSSGYVFPNGTIFTGFLNISEQSDKLLTASITWYINNDFNIPSLGLNLPYGLEIPVVDGEGNPVYTFNVNVNSNKPFDVALYVNTEIVVAYINSTFPNLDGKITITGIVTTF